MLRRARLHVNTSQVVYALLYSPFQIESFQCTNMRSRRDIFNSDVLYAKSLFSHRERHHVIAKCILLSLLFYTSLHILGVYLCKQLGGVLGEEKTLLVESQTRTRVYHRPRRKYLYSDERQLTRRRFTSYIKMVYRCCCGVFSP